LDTDEKPSFGHDLLPLESYEVRVYPESPWFQAAVRRSAGKVLRLVTRPDAGPRETILVNCVESAAAVVSARRLYPSHPILAVLAGADSGRIREVLARGADGVITLDDPPDRWRQSLHVLLGGGRWLGGPEREAEIEQKYANP
jgi:DNA-binding NarL/FixJ family response regulator